MAPRIFFFLFNILILLYFSKYETIETHALAFLTLIILVKTGVINPGKIQNLFGKYAYWRKGLFANYVSKNEAKKTVFLT